MTLTRTYLTVSLQHIKIQYQTNCGASGSEEGTGIPGLYNNGRIYLALSIGSNAKTLYILSMNSQAVLAFSKQTQKGMMNTSTMASTKAIGQAKNQMSSHTTDQHNPGHQLVLFDGIFIG